MRPRSRHITLPKQKAQLARLVSAHAERERGRLSYRRTRWLLAWYYLQGYRRFNVLNPSTGVVLPVVADTEDAVEFQSSDLVYAINQVAGRLGALDTRARVLSAGTTLDAFRSRAAAQILADTVTNQASLAEVQRDFAYLFTTLGSCGLVGHLDEHVAVGLTLDPEVVHPKEIMPFPSLGQDHTQRHGIMRERMLPIDYLKDTLSSRLPLDDMEWYEVDPGEVWMDADITTTSPTGFTRTGSTALRVDTVGVARVQELWLDGPGGTCTRYVVVSGDTVLHDEDLSTKEAYCPLGFARFMDNGTFHGAGVFDLMFSIHSWMEQMVRNLFTNIRDTDKYGALVLPVGEFNERTLLRDVGEGLRVINWEPDPTAEGMRPFPIQPVSLGDVPGRVAQFAREMFQGVNPLKDLLQEKGRVDSASALSFLDEQIQRSLTNPTTGVTKAWGDMWRSVVGRANHELTVRPRPLPLTTITTDLVGVRITDDDMVQFVGPPVPRLANLEFTVREVNPRSKVARKTEAVELAARGLMDDPFRFILLGLEEQLDFAMWQKDHQAAYHMVQRNIVRLFGDGETPGNVVVGPHTSSPDLQLRVLDAFMAGPEMAVASVEVRNAFIEYRKLLMSYLQPILPEQIPEGAVQ